MASETSNINELPVNPSISSNGQPIMAGSGSNNINLSLSEQTENTPITNYGEELAKQRGPAIAPTSTSQSDMRQIMHEASNLGLTELPNRDIPMNTQTIVTDENIKPNFIPPPQQQPSENTDYVTEHINKLSTQNQSTNVSRADEFYNEIQMPLLIAILFFIFQLPIFRKYFLNFLPSFHNKDGTPKLTGYVLNSAIFAILYYLITKALTHIIAM